MPSHQVAVRGRARCVLAALFLVIAYGQGGGAGKLGVWLPAGSIVLSSTFSLYTRRQLQVGYTIPHMTQLADRYAAGLTGDPIAVMVLLDSISNRVGLQAVAQIRKAPRPALPSVRAAWPLGLMGRAACSCRLSLCT